jgi:hypothetical protein
MKILSILLFFCALLSACSKKITDMPSNIPRVFTIISEDHIGFGRDIIVVQEISSKKRFIIVDKPRNMSVAQIIE